MIGTITILMNDNEKSKIINEKLHFYSENILGRMGLPHIEGKFILTFVFKGEEVIFNKLTDDLKNIKDIKIEKLMI